ncbi:MAG: DUF615 domain-containing protein [Myxococcales bacterium]|nr:DUF615 domain-containing protein [Myxococcales bacterium]
MGDEQDEDEERVVPRSHLRDQARAYLDLAEQLVKKPRHLPEPPFDDELRQAIAEARHLTKSARTRQIRLVAQLLRPLELEIWQRALAGRTSEAASEQERERLAEQWRTRLLEGGDVVLNEFVAKFEGADRQQLRQLIRQATSNPGTPEQPSAKAKRAATQVLRTVRELLPLGSESDADAGSGGDGG